MKVKVLAFDMDGTILRDDGSISERTMLALKKACENKLLLILATGRPISKVPSAILALEGLSYAIASNGACVEHVVDGHIIYKDYILLETAKPLFDLIDRRGYTYEVYSDGLSFCANRHAAAVARYFSDRGKTYRELINRIRFIDDVKAYFHMREMDVEKINIHAVPSFDRKNLDQAILQVPGVKTTSANQINLEINSETANKGAALSTLCKTLGVKKDEIFAIGDGENDLPLLATAGFSVAMGNALPMAKQIASYVTLDNEHDGFAVALEKFLI